VIDFSNTKGSKFVKFWSSTTTGSNNIETTNGIVHVVTPDHIFGFDEFVKRLTFVPPPPDLIKLIGGKLYLNYSVGVQRKWEQNVNKNIEAADRNWPALHK